MLVLSRMKDEVIEIAEGEIEIMVVEIRGDKVRLGIKAPRDIPVHRREVAEAIRREQREASGARSRHDDVRSDQRPAESTMLPG